ncbi:uncharacterized protein METZ01_LOCUS357803 [marine metagenome]|jgi:hypothetical protein|uniref:ACT domain-containing protein n=1 Tax=marine metagenome TaxID=408172 RepID=A0A382S4V3_9ZZZZ|tara:strand:- start:281 stop:658 length:378 start_codon:yes stop_codon:yes gene_type:complete
MQEFNVSLTDRPGELSQVASAVGDEGINILGCVGMGRSTASVTMVTDDEEATKKVLKSLGRDFEVNELILTSLPNKPGALAGMTTKLSDAGVNIKSFYIMKMELDVADVALTTDNPSKTKEILGI